MTNIMATRVAAGTALALLAAATLSTQGCASDGASDSPASGPAVAVHETTQALSVASTTPCGVTLSADAPSGSTPATVASTSILYPSQFTVPATIPYRKGTEPFEIFSGVKNGQHPSKAIFTFGGPLATVICNYSAVFPDPAEALKLDSCTGGVIAGSVQTAQQFSLAYVGDMGTWTNTIATVSLDLNVPPNSSTTVCLDSCTQGTDSCSSGTAAVCTSTAQKTCALNAPPTNLRVVKVPGGDGYIAGTIAGKNDQPILLRGANFPGPGSACYGGGGVPGAGGVWEGIFDGPATMAESIKEMKEWRINAVRIPLNQDCWLGVKTGLSALKGATYQSAIASAVSALKAKGMTVILDLHRSAPPEYAATNQAPMPDLDSTTFWKQVATAYKADTSIIFDLFNEPVVIDAKWDSSDNITPEPTQSDWACWRAGQNGVSSPTNPTNYCVAGKGLRFTPDATDTSVTLPYKVTGMAALLKAVRDVDPNRVVLLGGLYYATYFNKWVQAVQDMVTVDKLPASFINNVAASWHQYDNKHNTRCPDENNKLNGISWQTTCHPTALGTVQSAFIDRVRAQGYPVVIGEIGMHPYDLTKSLAPFKPPADGGVPADSTKIAEVKDWFNTLLTYADEHKIGYLAWAWSTSKQPWLLVQKTSAPVTYAPGFGFGQAYHEHLVNQPICCTP